MLVMTRSEPINLYTLVMSDRGDLTLSIFCLLTVRSQIWR